MVGSRIFTESGGPEGENPRKTGKARVDNLIDELWKSEPSAQIAVLRALNSESIGEHVSQDEAPITEAVLHWLEHNRPSDAALVQAIACFAGQVSGFSHLADRFADWFAAQSREIQNYSLAWMNYSGDAPSQTRKIVEQAIEGQNKLAAFAGCCAVVNGLLVERTTADLEDRKFVPENISENFYYRCLELAADSNNSGDYRILPVAATHLLTGNPWTTADFLQLAYLAVSDFQQQSEARIVSPTDVSMATPRAEVTLAQLKDVANYDPANYLAEILKAGIQVLCVTDYSNRVRHQTVQRYIDTLIRYAGLTHVVIPEPLSGPAAGCATAENPFKELLKLREGGMPSMSGDDRLEHFCDVFAPFVDRLTFVPLPEKKGWQSTHTIDSAPATVQGLVKIVNGNPNARLLFLSNNNGLVTKISDAPVGRSANFSLSQAMQNQLGADVVRIHHVLLAEPEIIERNNEGRAPLSRMGANCCVPVSVIRHLSAPAHHDHTIGDMWDSVLCIKGRWPRDDGDANALGGSPLPGGQQKVSM